MTSFPVPGLLALALFATCCPLISAQDFARRPNSPAPAELPGNQLIVWSETQKPRPVPTSPPEIYAPAAPAQILSGTILARNSELFFVAANQLVFGISDQGRFLAFAGKKVRVTGKLDASAQTLRVWSIQELK